LPSTDDPEYNEEFPDEVRPGLPVTDEAFEAMLQGFDQDALEADPGSPELLLHDEVDAPLDPDEDEGKEEEPLGEETKARRDFKAEATSLRHLLTHLPKNPHCVSCQQAKMRQRYSHKSAFKREISQFGEIITCDHVVAPAMRMQGLGGEATGLSVKDVFTGMIAIYPAIRQDNDETLLALTVRRT
jgi:hypothetical protein